MSNIDFENKSFLKMKKASNDEYKDRLAPLLDADESIVSTYKSVRDGVVFTTDRIIAINIQGLTGKKTSFTFLPYNKISAYSVESAGHIDLDSELCVWISGLGKVTFEFTGGCDIGAICRCINP